MSIDYSSLFGDVGAFVKRVNIYRGWASSNLAADLAAISGQLTTSAGSYPSIYAILGDVPNTIAGFQSVLTQTMASYMAGKTQTRFTDLATVVNQLPLGQNTNIQQVLAALIVDMLANSQTVQQCVTTLGSVSPSAANNGDSVVLLTKLLDGFNAPRKGAAANRNYAGLNSQLTVSSEEMFATCIQDQTSGLIEGQEQYQLSGGQPGNGPWDITEGSGQGPQITTLNGSGMVTNGEFEAWSSNTPTGWTIAAGTAGTNVFQDTVTLKRGLSSLQLEGDGTTPTITLTQAITQQLQPLQRYCLGVWMLGQSGIAAGTITIQLTGTGYTAGSTEKIVLNAAALAALTTWTMESFVVLMPAIVPALSISISVTGTLTSGKAVHVDGLGFGPVNYFGGIGVMISPGDTPALVGDRYQWSVANDLGGVFQTFSRKAYGVQLPSVVSSPSLSDSLAT